MPPWSQTHFACQAATYISLKKDPLPILKLDQGSGSLLVRSYKDAGSPSSDCSPTRFWKALKLLSMCRFTWFKKPALLIQALSFRWNQYWKDLGHLNTLKFAQTLPFKSTIFTQLTELWINLVKFCMQIEFPLWKNYLLWGVWIIWNMQFYFLTMGVYGKSGMSGWLWKCTKTFNSVMGHLLSESKVLGSSLTC